jgi:plastocyanin
MDRRTFLAAGTVVGTAGLSGCLAVFNSPGSDDADYDVGMADSAYEPATIEVSVGGTVVWKNTSGRAHTVTAYDDGLPEGAEYFASGGFESEQAARDGWEAGSGGIFSNDTYEHTFDVAGEYPYLCIPHERQVMTGTVVVTDE